MTDFYQLLPNCKLTDQKNCYVKVETRCRISNNEIVPTPKSQPIIQVNHHDDVFPPPVAIYVDRSLAKMLLEMMMLPQKSLFGCFLELSSVILAYRIQSRDYWFFQSYVLTPLTIL